MVHRVVKEVDRGEPLVVREIEIKEGESKEQLETRIHEVSYFIIGVEIMADLFRLNMKL